MRMFITAILVLTSGCVGARVGYRTGLGNEKLTGVYAGPWVTYAQPFGEVVGGLEASAMFAGDEGSFGAMQPQIYMPITGSLDGPVVVGALGIGLDVDGDSPSFHLSGCALVLGHIRAYGDACVRGSTRGWVGTDVGAGAFVVP